jgi:DNA-binding NarL/FixJ family response regulator
MSASRIKTNPKRRIVIIDDHPLVREGLMQLIRGHHDLAICGEADSVTSAKDVILRHNPDLAILELRLNKGDGLDLIDYFHSQFPTVKILVLSQLDEMLYAERALRYGASGYLMKEGAAKEIIIAIRKVLGGGLYVSPVINEEMLRRLIKAPVFRPSSGVESLTDRELQIFQKLGSGMSSRQIASELFLSIKTVEAHRENIKAKIGAPDRTSLIHEATKFFQKSTATLAKA